MKHKQGFGKDSRIICLDCDFLLCCNEGARGIVLLKDIAKAIIISILLGLLGKGYEILKKHKERRFCDTRKIAQGFRPLLTKKVIKHYSLDQGDILLHPKDYSFPKPVPVDNVKLVFVNNDDSAKQIVQNYEKLFKKFWPLKCKTYSDAVYRMENPDSNKFYDGLSYRLLDVKGTDSLEMQFSPASYFQYFNVGEALILAEAINLKSNSCSKYRKYFSKHLDLKKFVFTTGIQTVSIRLSKDRKQAHFYMLYRDPDKVAIGGKLLCLLPAGEFQPATMHSNMESDLSFWRNIMRESVEEFLNQVVNQNVPDEFNYNIWPYPELNKAKNDGKITVWLLGYGACPLNYKMDFLTACIYEAETFDEIFGDRGGKDNEEGRIFNPLPFTREQISKYTDINQTTTTAIACLQLAYKYRKELGIPCADDPEATLEINTSL